jgi:zinc protease
MKRFMQEHDELAHTIEGGMELYGKRFLAGGDHRFGLPATDLLQKISLEDIQSWVSPPLKNSPIEISIVGDFEPEAVIDLAAIYMGSLPFRNKTEAVINESRLPKFPNAQTYEITVPTVINKAIVDVAYPTADFWNISQTRRLVILGEIFSDRLRENIREKQGASYTTFAFNNSSRTYKGYGLFQAIAMVDPAEKESVTRGIQKISSNMISDGISEDEMKRALDPVITSLKDLKRNNRYWLNNVLIELKKYPQQLDWCRTMMHDYESITEKELKSLAEKFLDNQKAAIVVINPGQKD